MAPHSKIKMQQLGDGTQVQRIILVDNAGSTIVEFGGGDPSTDGEIIDPVDASIISVELLPANPDRVEAFIRNTGTGILYIVEGAVDASANSAIQLFQNDVWKVTSNLVVNGIWTSANGFANINEKTM